MIARIIAILAVIAGIWMNIEGYPETGYTAIKLGIALFIVSALLGLIKISKNSRGTRTLW